MLIINNKGVKNEKYTEKHMYGGGGLLLVASTSSKLDVYNKNTTCTHGVPVYSGDYRFQDYCCTNDPNISFERDEGFVLNDVPNGLLYGPVCCKSGTYFAWDDLTSFVGRCLAD